MEHAAHHVPEGVALRLALCEVEGSRPVDGACCEAVAQRGRARRDLEGEGALGDGTKWDTYTVKVFH